MSLKSKSLLSLLLLVTGVCAYAQEETPAQPGTLNYVEGQVTLAGAPLSMKSVGKTTLQPTQLLETRTGRAEILLTPGVFLRVGANSAVAIVSPEIMHTEVSVVRGKADVEVDQIYKENVILVDQEGTQTQLLKAGLYAFNIPNKSVRVFDGEAEVSSLDAPQDARRVKVKAGHKLLLNGEPTKPEHFNKGTSEDGLYAWSSLRSEYLGAANENLATEYAGVDGFDPGWFWDQNLFGYTWLPGDGMMWSPFGFGFYSPYYLDGGGMIYGRRGYGRGGYGGGYGHRGDGGEFHGRVGGGMRGGGFHGGGGGGFHGGGGHGGGGHR
jgi:hypothetical protein